MEKEEVYTCMKRNFIGKNRKKKKRIQSMNSYVVNTNTR